MTTGKQSTPLTNAYPEFDTPEDHSHQEDVANLFQIQQDVQELTRRKLQQTQPEKEVTSRLVL